jgi:ribulose-phosphate 3-epimerase
MNAKKEKIMSNIIISPSILSADFANLERDVERVEEAGADWIHVDVMDGHFVPNITIGAPVVKSLRKITNMPLDVHLMIENPENYIKDFIDAGSDYITIHYEAVNNVKDLIDQIKIFGVKAGVSIKPKTPASVLAEFISDLDLVLIMTVEPGFGGQKFMTDCLPKISEVKNMLVKYDLTKTVIEVDGGIDDKTAKLAIEAGASALVAGSYIYNSPDIKAAVESLRY